jgi:hypothetical protein
MTEKTWPSRKEMLENGITVDEDRDNEVPDYARAKAHDEATGPKAPAHGESSPPSPSKTSAS